MGRLRQKGKAGAAKAYMTRSMAVKKLQCSLADFRRLCILKGYRVPTTRASAQETSRAQSFCKRLARALGRGEWSSAKSLEDNKPVYRLDHIIKERYPTFVDAVRDIDDALCMIFLFSSLPSNTRVSPALVENCSRLAAEWQLYIMHTRSLRKIFLSIKGVYYQAEVMDQTITWLVPYQFTQNVPTDVDVRVMLTFLELYQTLLGFVFFKLYTDAGLVYPPPLDAKKEEAAAGVGAFSLQEANRGNAPTAPMHKTVEVAGKKVSSKDVRQTIKSISISVPAPSEDVDEEMPVVDFIQQEAEEEFVPRPSASNPEEAAALPTLHSLSSLPQSQASKLLVSCVFFLSRETARPIFEFIVRSFGGRIGWPASSGGGSPFDETDDSITHVIIDRPVVEKANETDEERERRRRRKFYWRSRAYDPLAAAEEDADMEEVNAEESEAEDEGVSDGERETAEEEKAVLRAAAAAASDDLTAQRAAELEAEAAGVDYGTFEQEVAKSQKKVKKVHGIGTADAEEDMNKMMMSNKQRKLYEKMKYGQRKRAAENAKLEERKKSLQKAKRRQEKAK
ncbi:hypothetical protein EW146_g1086 [Bondarzewia mesenterica]|uniref:Pescadillo homolog n=1 Tax=Bondarzewia mesenterica TaxID=1095465 RepID=A0A4V3XG65_9AGAM|nr:hypothetical protein EW146_g1086 [Bondarzewia mesenterica]